MKNNIAIDGPGGAGKSSVAKELAKKLNCIYVDTGAMYRAVALFFIEKNISLEDEVKISTLVNNINIELLYENGSQKVLLEGVDVSNRIREQDASSGSSKVAALEKVRQFLVEKQKEIGKNYDVVMDGRDIGTTVLKDAKFKFYLDANIDVRAKRRFKELKEKGINTELETIKKEIEERDFRDKNRKITPLTLADDGIFIDTSNLSFVEVVEKMYDIIKKGE